jgi:hypothetical protein
VRSRTAVLAGAAALLALLATGCSQQHYDERGKADGPVAGRHGDDTPAEVYNFPDGFGNLATKCVGKGKRGYATTLGVQRDDDSDDDGVQLIPAQEVVVDDPECTGAQ